MRVYRKITDLIGGTPLLELTNYEKANRLNTKIYAKLEYFNPAGSVKDRIAKAMLDDADEVCDFPIYTHGKVSLKHFI